MPHAEPSEMLVAFRQVAAYRQIIKHISQSANGTLVWGGILFFLWFMVYGNNGQPRWDRIPVYGYIHLALASTEILVGLWKKFAPSPVAFLLDAIVLLGFVGSWAWRAYDDYQRVGTVPIVSVGVCLYFLYTAYQQFQAWQHINRALIYRPSREQLAKFDEIVRDVRRANPEADTTALDLRTRPGWRALLLGDIAFFVASTGDIVVAPKSDVDLEIETDEGEANGPGETRPAVLWLPGGQFGPFPLDPRNAANFVAWKSGN